MYLSMKSNSVENTLNAFCLSSPIIVKLIVCHGKDNWGPTFLPLLPTTYQISPAADHIPKKKKSCRSRVQPPPPSSIRWSVHVSDENPTRNAAITMVLFPRSRRCGKYGHQPISALHVTQQEGAKAGAGAGACACAVSAVYSRLPRHGSYQPDWEGETL